MSNQVALDDRTRCDGCGTLFEPTLDGDLCPTCVEIVIEHNLDPTNGMGLVDPEVLEGNDA